MPLRRLLVAVDYSECSLRALRFAGELAAQLGARVDVVHAWDAPSYLSGADEAPPGGARPSIVELVREQAERELKDFVDAAALPRELAVTSQLLAGAPAAATISALATGEYDLAVVGTHGRSGLQQVLMGSVAARIVELSPTPVVTVPRPPRRGR